jgi:hypothetical protein
MKAVAKISRTYSLHNDANNIRGKLRLTLGTANTTIVSWIFQVFAGQTLAEKANRIHLGSAPHEEVFRTRRP